MKIDSADLFDALLLLHMLCSCDPVIFNDLVSEFLLPRHVTTSRHNTPNSFITY